MPPTGPSDRDDEPRWMRLLEPLRSERAMFNLLLVVVAICAVVAGVTLLVRAVS